MKKITISILALLLQSCATIENYQNKKDSIEITYDHSPLILKAPQGHCFYDEKIPLESDVVKVVRIGNYNTYSKIEFVFQDCEEKRNFLNNKHPLFRKNGMIILSSASHLGEVHKYRLNRDRETYLKFSNKLAASDTAESMTEFVKKTAIPEMKAKSDIKFIDKSVGFTKEQKDELRLMHSAVFGKEDFIFLSYHAKLEPNFASYDYQEAKVGNVITKCIGAATMINYMPITLALCEEKSSEDWSNLEKQMHQYLELIMKLNSDFTN